MAVSLLPQLLPMSFLILHNLSNSSILLTLSDPFQSPWFFQFSLPSLLPQLLPSFPRKEVIQPHLPVRLPCYDFVPVIRPTLGSSSLAVRSPTSGVSNSHDVTGGVYKARERIHRSMADLRLLATPASCRRVAACNLNYERLWWDSLQVAPSLPIVPPIVACV